jgi:hypothetical protein
MYEEFHLCSILIFTRAIRMLQQPREDDRASAESQVALQSSHVRPARAFFDQDKDKLVLLLWLLGNGDGYCSAQ